MNPSDEIRPAVKEAKQAINDGGQAFPCPNPDFDGNWNKERGLHGMSLRDWIAGMALQGFLANPGGPIQSNGINGWNFVNCLESDVADLSYIMADVMLTARTKGGQDE